MGYYKDGKYQRCAAEDIAEFNDTVTINRACPVGVKCVEEQFLDELLISLRHGRTFITSREKMNPSGIYLWDDLISRLKHLI